MTDDQHRSRGVRLTDLDRAFVYRIGYVGRRWEVLGPEVDFGAAAPAPPLRPRAGRPRPSRAEGTPPHRSGAESGLSS